MTWFRLTKNTMKRMAKRTATVIQKICRTITAPKDQRSLALSLRAGVNQASSTVAPVVIGPLMAVAGATLGFPVAAVVGVGFLAAAIAVGGHREPSAPESRQSDRAS